MKNKPSIQFVLSLDLFPYECLVSINKTPKQVQKQLTEFGKPLSKEMYDYIKSKPANSAVYIFNPESATSVIFINAPSIERSISLFDHEKMHFLHHVFTKIGLTLTDSTEEVYAYSSEHLMKNFLSKIFG